MTMETSKCRSHSCKKKIPKRINKAEREKMKRDNLNGLFLALAASLEASDKNNGKVSVLIEAARLVKDMVAQIERLKKENVALLSESQYVMVEKNELRDENSCLEAEIGEMQREISSKVSEPQLDLNISLLERCNQEARDDHMLPRLVQDGENVRPLRQDSSSFGASDGAREQTTCSVSYTSRSMAFASSRTSAELGRIHRG